MNDFLPYGRHMLDEDDIAAVVDVLKNGLLTTGAKVPELESALSRYLGGPEVVVCSSGTAALHLAAISAGLSENTCAIVPAITFLATANAVRMTGADVVFADVDPKSGLMTAQTLKDAIERAEKPVAAVMPVQLTGQSPNMKDIGEVAASIDACLITDSCHALGATKKTNGEKLGAGLEEDYACFSFHPVKAIAMGEGGAIVTRDKAKADKMRLLRSHAMQRPDRDDQPWAYEMYDLGYNYRATDMQAALGLSQLKKLDGFIEKRRELACYYAELLKPLAPNLMPIEKNDYATSAWHIYSVLINFVEIKIDRASFMKMLDSKGIGSQVHYIPVCDQPYYKKLYGEQNLPGAASYYSKTLTLPLYPAMQREDVARVVASLTEILVQTVP